MTTTSEARSTIDRSDTEATLYRVAICAFTYYPGKPHDEPGCGIEDDVTWCAAPLRGLPKGDLVDLRATIRAMITDPSADRRAFIAILADLADE